MSLEKDDDWCGKLGHWFWQHLWRRGKVFLSFCLVTLVFVLLTPAYWGLGSRSPCLWRALKSTELFHRNTEDFSRYSALHMLQAKNLLYGLKLGDHHPSLGPEH